MITLWSLFASFEITVFSIAYILGDKIPAPESVPSNRKLRSTRRRRFIEVRNLFRKPAGRRGADAPKSAAKVQFKQKR